MEATALACSLLVVCTLSVPPLANAEIVSGFKATQIWGRLVKVAQLRPAAAHPAKAEEQDDAVASAIASNRVPKQKMLNLEYLPSLLATKFTTRVPPSARVAMSYYLCDNYDIDKNENQQKSKLRTP